MYLNFAQLPIDLEGKQPPISGGAFSCRRLRSSAGCIAPSKRRWAGANTGRITSFCATTSTNASPPVRCSTRNESGAGASTLPVIRTMCSSTRRGRNMNGVIESFMTAISMRPPSGAISAALVATAPASQAQASRSTSQARIGGSGARYQSVDDAGAGQAQLTSACKLGD